MKAKKLNIGLVIDLTTSFKYYDPAGWSDFDIEYRKLRCDGSHLMERRLEFYDIVDEYLRKEPGVFRGLFFLLLYLLFNIIGNF